MRYNRFPSKAFALGAGLALATNSYLPLANAAPPETCKQAVIRAYERMGQQAAALATTPATVAEFRLAAETYYLAPGKKQLSKVARIITMATQHGNTYYADGSTEAYSNDKERVIIDRAKHTVLIIDAHGNPGGYANTMALIRNTLLAKASLQACTEAMVDGQPYKKVAMLLPSDVAARTHVSALECLVNTRGDLYQTTLNFTENEPVRKVRFTILPKLGTSKTTQTVAPPLSYIYRPDHTLQASFAQYSVSDQRRTVSSRPSTH